VAESVEPLSSPAGFQSARQFIVERHGVTGWQIVRQTLAERHGFDLPDEITGGGRWLPTAWFLGALRVGRELFGPPDFHERFGWAAAEYEMSWVHRVALRFTSPMWLMEHGADYWRQMHNTGAWHTEGHKGWIRGTLRDFGVVDGEFCDSLRAWLQRACIMTGAGKAFVLERECRADGAPACIFEGTW
jgi:hypothetical protein